LYLAESEHLIPVYKNGFCVNDEVESLLNACFENFMGHAPFLSTM